MFLEIVQFELIEEVDEDSFLEAVKVCESDFLENQEGYINDEMCKGEDNNWVHIVRWESREEAEEAMDKAMSDPVCSSMFDMMDKSSINSSFMEVMN